MTNQSTHICKITTNNDLTLTYRSYHLLADNTRVFLVFFVPDSTLKLVKYVRHTRIYHWQSRSCFMSLTFVCISSKQFVDVQHSIKREAFKILKRERRNRVTFVSKMYLSTRLRLQFDVRCGRMFSRVPVCMVLHVSMIIFLYFVLSKNCML